MAITLTQLTSFLAVVRGGSVTAAADELIVTQPSVSSAISALSKELGCDLFQRVGRGIELTEAGTAFVPYAEDVVGLLDRGRQAVTEVAAASLRRLQIAAVTTAAESFVPGLMRSFSEAHPETELSLVVGNYEDVVNRVLTHRDDIAISGRPPDDERLLAEPIMRNEIVCITAPDDPLVGEGPVSAAALGERPWLLREKGSGTRALNERFLADRGLTPRWLTLGSNGAIKQAARVGVGVSLLSRAAVETELESGLLGEVRLKDGPESRPWFVLRSAVGPTRPAVSAFAEFVTRQGADPPAPPSPPKQSRPAR
jgi:LysR family transcriptional regulator, low CO2-responsive transcriptional regulator